MKRLHLILAALLLLTSVAVRAEEDSMSTFKALIQNASPAATDIGALVGPEIFNLDNYPANPVPGQQVTVRATVLTYTSMASYTVTGVTLSYKVNGGEPKTVAMKAEDGALGIYSATLPAFAEGDEVMYSIAARDSWGNAAYTIAPGTDIFTIMEDTRDKEIDSATDITSLEAAYAAPDDMKLCLNLAEKTKAMLGTDAVAYGIAVVGEDSRYRNDKAESELGLAYLAAHVPFLNLTAMAPISELGDAISGKSKSAGATVFSKKGGKLCFSFSPYTVRADAGNGLKVAGITLAAQTSPLVPKPKDTTHIVMLYPGIHSFVVTAGK